jgi:hypothetical protein
MQKIILHNHKRMKKCSQNFNLLRNMLGLDGSNGQQHLNQHGIQWLDYQHSKIQMMLQT